MRLLVTGGLGFIGSHYIEYVLASHPGDEVVNLDAHTYAAVPDNLAQVEADYSSRYRLVKGDVCDATLIGRLMETADAVVHFAAETHVDRSILDAAAFARTNVVGTQTLLHAAERVWNGADRNRHRFVYVSTDEVYGALALENPSRFSEEWPLRPRSPYSASKAGGDLMAQAYHHTFGLPAMVTRCSNNYGPRQFPEKFIPLMILNTLSGRELPVYGDGLYVRDWIFVEDNCRATDLVLRRGRPGEAYNIGAGGEQSNLEVLAAVMAATCRLAGLDLEERKRMVRHVADRPGHDRRYAVDAGKLINELGFAPMVGFSQGIERTVRWYLDNPGWVKRVSGQDYQAYYRQQYDHR